MKTLLCIKYPVLYLLFSITLSTAAPNKLKIDYVSLPDVAYNIYQSGVFKLQGENLAYNGSTTHLSDIQKIVFLEDNTPVTPFNSLKTKASLQILNRDIVLALAEAARATIEWNNVQGKSVFIFQGDLPKGKHSFALPDRVLHYHGVSILNLTVNGTSYQKKMVFMEEQ